MKKAELMKTWKQLDGACEALDRLQEHGIDTEYVDFSAIVSLKNEVEEMIQSKSRTRKEDLK